MKISSIKINGQNPLNKSSNPPLSKGNEEIANPQFLDFLLELFAFGKANPAFLSPTITQNNNNSTISNDATNASSEIAPNFVNEDNQNAQKSTKLEDYLKTIFPDTILNNYSDFELTNLVKASNLTDDNFVNVKSILTELVNKDQTLQLSNLINLNSGFTSDVKEKLESYLPKEILKFFEKDLNSNNYNIQKELYQIALLFEKKAEMKIEKISNTQTNVETLANFLTKEQNITEQKAANIIESQSKHVERTNISKASAEQLPQTNIIKDVMSNIAKPSNEDESVNNNASSFSHKTSEINEVNTNKTSNEQIKNQKEYTTFTNNQGLQLPNFFKTEDAPKFSFFPNVKMEDVPNVINKMLVLNTQNGVSKASISLQPNNLGMIFVNLEIKKDFVTITLRAEKIETLEKIQGTAQSLKEALVSQGFKNENINLKFEYNQTTEQKYSLNDQGNFNKKQNNQNFTREYSNFLGKMDEFAKSIEMENNTAGVVK